MCFGLLSKYNEMSFSVKRRSWETSINVSMTDHCRVIIILQVLQGWALVFRHLKCAVCGELVHLKISLRKYQMKKSIIPTLPENFNEIKQSWHRLQPQT